MSTQLFRPLPASPLAPKMGGVLPPTPAAPMPSLSKAGGWGSAPVSGGWWGSPKPALFNNPYIGMLTNQPAVAPVAAAPAGGGFGSYGNDNITADAAWTAAHQMPAGGFQAAPAPIPSAPALPAPVAPVAPAMGTAPQLNRMLQTIQQRLPQRGAFWDSPRR